jgi:hypothetical protein
VTVIQYVVMLSGSTGEVSVIDVELFTVTELAVTVLPPDCGTKLTDAPLKNPVPVIVMAVPPVVTPLVGVTPLTPLEQLPFGRTSPTHGTAGAYTKRPPEALNALVPPEGVVTVTK